MGNLIISGKHYCEFCGKVIPRQYEEYSEYFQCECSDAKNERKIYQTINELKASLPKAKYNSKEVINKI